MPVVIETLIAGLFGQVFGNALVAGIMLLLITVVLIFALKLPFEASLVVLLPAMFIATFQSHLLPEWLGIILLLVCGFIIYMAVTRVTHR